MDTVIVASSQFYSHYPRQIPKGSVNAEQVEIRLDKSWDGLTVRIHWLNVASGVEKVVLLELDQPNTIPWEVLTDLGELRMGLVGLDGEAVIKPTIWLTYGYVTDGVDPESGSDPKSPTPSWEQQMVEQATAAANAAKAAKETADNLQASAEAGEFNGDPGPAGPPGKSPIIRNGTWWIWNNDSKDYTDTGVVASGGGGGTTDYNKLTNRPSIGGILLEGNKTAEQLGLAKASQIPNVPSWAMQQKKPTYTAQEVGAQPQGDYALRSEIPAKLPNPYALTIKGKTYDGSQPVDVEVADGKTPNIQIGTVETLEPGADATANFTGTAENPLLNFGIPRGDGRPSVPKTPQIDYTLQEDSRIVYFDELDGSPLSGYGFTYARIVVENSPQNENKTTEGYCAINRLGANISAQLSMGSQFVWANSQKYFTGWFDTKTGQAISVSTNDHLAWRNGMSSMIGLNYPGETIKSIGIATPTAAIPFPEGTNVKVWFA